MNGIKGKRALLILALLICLLCGCGKGGNEDGGGQAAVSGKILLADGGADAAQPSYQAEAVSVPESVGRFQAVKADASGIYLYSQFEAVGEDARQGGTIYALDYGGHILWSYEAVMEESGGYITGLYDFLPDENGLWLMAETYESEKKAGEFPYVGSSLLHIGAEGDTVTADREAAIDFLPSAPVSWVVDAERECFYLLCVDYDGMKSTLLVVDYDGNCLFEVTDNAYLSHPCLTADGQLAICGSMNNQTFIKTLDWEAQAWGAEYALDNSIGRMYGGAQYDLYFIDGEYKTLYGMDFEAGVCTPVLNLLDYGVGADILSFAALEESEFLLVSDGTIKRLCLSDDSAGTETKVLTLATFDYLMTSFEVLEFNSAQSEYRIEIRDYSEYNVGDDNTEGLNQLNLDIASGDAPDIYDLRSLPISQYVRQGILEDMNPYLDADPDIDRADYVESLLSAMEIDGGLYGVMPHVCMLSLAVSPDRLDGEETLTFAQMLEIAGGSDPFGAMLTRYDFIQYMLAGSNSPFVDWADGSCRFDSEEFICLLELASLLPADKEEMYAAQGDRDSLPQLVLSLSSDNVAFIDASLQLDCLSEDGGCAAFVGTPGADGMSYLLIPSWYSWGMSSQSGNKDGAWAFIRRYLQEDFQSENGMPLLKSCWDSRRESYERWISNGGDAVLMKGPDEVELSITSDVYFDESEALMQKANGIYEENPALMEIIWSEAQGYFAGDKTAEKAAQNIQSRVSLYMAEQG